MKLAIVGSTTLSLDQVRPIIEDAVTRHAATLIVSGGAQGVDTWAEIIARERGLETVIFRPTVARWAARGGYRERNRQIAETCDVLIRIIGARSKTYGSGWTRDVAARLGKPTEEFIVEP